MAVKPPLDSETLPTPRMGPPDEAILRSVVSGLIGAALLISFAVIHVMVFRRTGRVVGAGLAATELVTAILFLVRRQPMASTTRVTDWMVGLVGSLGSLLARPGGAHSPAGFRELQRMARPTLARCHRASPHAVPRTQARFIQRCRSCSYE